jgi:hypothetical protein
VLNCLNPVQVFQDAGIERFLALGAAESFDAGVLDLKQ